MSVGYICVFLLRLRITKVQHTSVCGIVSFLSEEY